MAVGDLVTNPNTGAVETVVEVKPDGSVLTDQNNAILTRVTVGDVYVLGGTDYKIASVTTNPAGRVISIVLKEDGGPDTITQNTLMPFVDDPNGGLGGITPGNPGGPVTIPIPVGNSNVVYDRQVGPRGSDGRNGYGVEVCFGFGKFKKCFTAERSGNPGDPGGAGPTVNRTVTVGNNGNIQTVTPGISGVTLISQGGDGGNGGDAFGNIDAKPGGAAGFGGSVIGSSSVEISTSGANAHGIFAQSRGGRGGDGGSGFIFSSGSVGGPASAGGTVNITNTGKILTIGPRSVGIFAQSIGGGGGQGGSSYGIVGDAGSGSTGGNGNSVIVTNSGNIETRGVDSHGILAQSIGGTGGNSGDAVGIVALGGDNPGAGGGSAGAVVVRNNSGGTILTRGNGSSGIIAQSIGGGGGNGGVSAGIVSFGSKGSRGGNGGGVDVRTQANTSIETIGISSHGIFAQSIGGGGGTGGTAGGLAALGAGGSGAGDAGLVIVENRGTILTRNFEAKGIFAQSIGGGGGSASGTGGAVALGGAGGSGGNASTVNVNNFGAIETHATGGDAIFAQSIGGGGGSGAATGGIVAIGGAGSSGGSGNHVAVGNDGSILTLGSKARGIFAQSIGGGGGAGGDGGGIVAIGGSGSGASTAGNVTATNSGRIETRGNSSSAIQLQSIGGGGGDGGSSGGIVAIGGAGGAGGNSGIVSAANSGSISTLGNDSQGIFVQSIGGGGGNGGSATAVGAFVSVGLGGRGGNGGNGGRTTVSLAPRTVIIGGVPTDVNPLISTKGDRSNAILAQSVGGGGGNGGFTSSVAAGLSGAATFAIGGEAGNGGTGGEVDVSGNVSITTEGVNSNGIVAQSIGGGGGNGGASVTAALAAGQGGAVSASFGVGGKGGNGGNASKVKVLSGGSITTDGAMSDGLVAQSIGGGGGNGGYSLSLSGAASDVAAVGVSVGVGGTGGDGGSAGIVDAQYVGNITTRQADSSGVILQSIGGSGGNGGFNVSGAVSGAGAASGAVTAGVGGSGGGGGNGGTVIGNIGGGVRTQSDRSSAIIAQSLGGGGGNGGFNISGSLTGAGTAAGSASVGVGGSGGGAGAGATVNLTVNALVTTDGEDSDGIVAQSVGGGGGNGGFNVSGSIGGAGTAAGSVSVGVGGAGGDGGTGGIVILRAGSTVVTKKRGSDGVIAQSVGGGGGNGGFNTSLNLTASGTGAGAASIGVGGAGGGGSAGGTVDVSWTGGISTEGDNANGYLSQSVGGGGGNGGFSVSGAVVGTGTGAGAVSAGVGGSGGGGGAGGIALTRGFAGDIITSGHSSNAFTNQSIGGGGGNGGFSVSGGLAVAGTGAGTVSAGVGGSGGSGGFAGLAESNMTGTIATAGDNSHGFLNQSVGGGGGNGGFNVTGSLSAGGSGAGSVGVGVGGSGGTGGVASTALTRRTGDTITTGTSSNAFTNQSIGGGGGNGGFNVAAGLSASGTGAGAVSVGIGGSGGGGSAAGLAETTTTGNITTEGDNSYGYLNQSVGGGGGSGGFNVSGGVAGSGTGAGSVSVGVGGSGGGGGAGGTALTRSYDGNITTKGRSSNAFTNQSIGGGGGNGGFNVDAGISATGTGAGTVSVGIGGSGGSGGFGGQALIGLTGDIFTEGENSYGVLNQSVGGGGGNGGFNVTGSMSAGGSGAGSAGVGVGGSGGSGGIAATAGTTVTGNITTLGNNANAYVNQSIGGGGGNGAFNVSATLAAANTGSGAASVGVGGSGGGGGAGGTATTTFTGDINTRGENSNAFINQSIGGGGGNGGFNVSGGLSAARSGAGVAAIGVGGFGGAGGDGGIASSNFVGNITTDGKGSNGVLVQSVGGGGGNGAINVSGSIAASSQGAGTVGIGVGGFGGNAGNGNSATFDMTANITTTRDNSYGALVQSIGGSGGNGAVNVTGAASLSTGNSGAIGVGIGGFGGTAGSATTAGGSLAGIVSTSGANSFGVMVQSVGGGGGNGGVNVSSGLSVGTKNSGAVSIGIGGFGASGGNGGDVNAARIGNTQTTGVSSDAVTFQSLGGGGGNGAINVSSGIAGTTSGTSAAFSLGVGGFGGTGGTSGNVTGSVTGDVIATAENSPSDAPADLAALLSTQGSNGVAAQSVGGGGGNGGINVSGGISLGSPSGGGNYNASIGLGGFGGAGGNAGVVDLTVLAERQVVNGTVQSQGVVVANGNGKSAIIAQSIGGGGGNGGVNVSGGISMDGGITAGIGGFGGSAGQGNNVTASATAEMIMARGARSRGFVAQSIGGGGGDGAINVSGGIKANKKTDKPNVVFGLGGSGGPGNISGIVTATHSGTVDVAGVESIGILAQSVAGGGGAGGFNVTESKVRGKGYDGKISIGGNAGAGADSGDVTLTSDGAVTVDGTRTSNSPVADVPLGAPETDFTDRANGILVQSIGGGGGSGVANVDGILAPFGKPLVAGVGGSGGAGGNAGAVLVNRGMTTQALLQTKGNQANAMIAQSVGGGGGDAGLGMVLSASNVSNTGKQALMLTVGGSGGVAGNGSNVTVNQKGDVLTAGDQSVGILAQSVGGGGGNANIRVAKGVNKAAKSFNLALGGAAGNGGTSGDVSVDQTGNIVTNGRGSSAIIAQSIGGGGGSATLDMVDTPGTSKSLNIGLGRRGGSGGAAGNVTVKANGIFSTKGDSATAIIAQSVGNGGGLSSALSLSASKSSANGNTAKSVGLDLSVGLEGGSGGTGGMVDVTADGTILTDGTASHGIHAQSIGGGGGVGGSVANSVFGDSRAASVAVGGAGGTGAKSGTVDVNSTADILTKKEGSHGIYAQSIGGAGGTGGSALTDTRLVSGASTKGSKTAAVTVGGSGGSGAESEKVTVTSTGIIETKANRSAGIVAQSIGGGGGDAGLVINKTVTGGQESNTISVGIGGSGGSGGIGRAVTAENGGQIWTLGTNSYGIFAQSIGGGGGNGSIITSQINARPTGGNSTKTLDVNIGGSGGTGGSSGDINVTNQVNARIDTEGKSAHGIFAQSIGGGGGNGSTILSQTDGQGKNSILAGFNIGGSGGSGSKAGSVAVTNDGAIQTLGDEAHGVFAQSIGGGGGNGGFSMAMNELSGKDSTGKTPLLSIGGKGGSGENAGDIKVANTGTIRTEGKNSHGILAQSIGGGGGNASLGVSAGKGSPRITSIANTISARIGGEGGGSGGLGGKVTISHSGDITVIGEGSQAIKAQSINGGGGDLILDMDGVRALQAGNSVPTQGGGTALSSKPEIVLKAGAAASENTSAEAVTVNATGTFGLTGNHNTGSAIQAIGGGGGTSLTQIVLADDPGLPPAGEPEITSTLGGDDGKNNNGAAISGGHTGNLLARGLDTLGTFIQSIGGGGGRTVIEVDTSEGEIGSATLKLGAAKGTSETGGDVTYAVNGDIDIAGNQSTGVLTQSIGGGGGLQTFSISSPPSSLAALVPVNVELGAVGGMSNDGAAMVITRTGGTFMTGDNASGIVLQSIGAGGGVSLTNVETAALDVQLGGSSGVSGNGEEVRLVNMGMVSTDGLRSHGIFLQSIGGGGGAVFHDADRGKVNSVLRGNNSGNGENVMLTQTGGVITMGEESFGVVAQSIGGGGGFVDGAYLGTAGGSGTGGKINLNIDGSIITFGKTSTAVLAQSAGKSGGDIFVKLEEGHAIIGGAEGIGIDLKEGADNKIINGGLVTTVAFVDGLAVSGTTGNDEIENSGVVIGNVKLEKGANKFSNLTSTSLFNMGNIVDLGTAGNQLFNNGIIELGDTGFIETVSTTELGGSFVQTSSAHIFADFDFVAGSAVVGKIDRINATGSASLDGTFNVLVVNPNKAAPGSHKVTFFTTQQDMAEQNLTLNIPVSAVANYGIVYPSSKEAALQYVIDFSPGGLNNNQTSFGDFINRVQLADGSDAFADLIGTIFRIKTLDELKIAYDSLSPEPYANNLQASVSSIDDFNESMMSCRNKDGDFRYVDEGNCAWGQFFRAENNYSGNSSNFAYNEEVYRFSAGVQHEVFESLHLGFAGSFENTNTRSGANALSDEKRYQSGMVLKYRDGATKFSQSLIGGYGEFDTTRNVVIGAVGGITDATQKIAFGATHARLSHQLALADHVYLMPLIDGAATFMKQMSFAETGGGLTNLSLAERSEVYFSVEPRLELGGDINLTDTAVLRAKIQVGVLHRFGDMPSVAATLVGTPAGISPFITTTGRDDTLLTLNAGLDAISDEGLNIGLVAGAQFGDDTQNWHGSMKAIIPF